jgi:hypothetical protein
MKLGNKSILIVGASHMHADAIGAALCTMAKVDDQATVILIEDKKAVPANPAFKTMKEIPITPSPYIQNKPFLDIPKQNYITGKKLPRKKRR